MPNLLVQVTLPASSGMAEDNAVNTFAINQGGDGLNDLAFADAIIDFYNAAHATFGVSVAGFLSSHVARTPLAATVKLFTINGALPMGSPRFLKPWTVGGLNNTNATPLPAEVAFAITLEAAGRADAPVETGGGLQRPKQRHTGRIFLGPLVNQTVELVGGIARPSEQLQLVCRDHIVRLDNALKVASTVADLAVWSRKDGVVRSLEAVSTDNAFDTQRRRGHAPSLRTRKPMDEV